MFYYEDLCLASFEKTTLGTAKDPSCGHWAVETLKFDGAHIRLLTAGKSNIEGFVDFFDSNYDGTNGYAVYVKGRMGYHTTANRANYKE